MVPSSTEAASNDQNNLQTTTGGSFMKIRNGIKSRNGNFSLSENRNDSIGSASASPFMSAMPLGAGMMENMVRGSIGAGSTGPGLIMNSHGTNHRNYESDTSIFNEIKNNLNDSSFNENIFDKNKLMFSN